MRFFEGMDNKVFLDLASDILLGDKMLCPGRMANLIHYAMQVNSLPGDMVEFGCYTGRTAALLAPRERTHKPR